MAAPKVIAVLGTSFCGSSLLNMMLDSHPAIFGAGELHKIYVEDRAAFCSICLQNCSFWAEPELNGSIARRELYEAIAARSGEPVVVDSSKTPAHFMAMKEAAPQTDFLPVVMTKHPMRLVASFLGNQFIPKNVGLDRYRESGFEGVARDDLLTAIDSYLGKAAKLYRTAVDVADQIGGRHLPITYEGVVESPRETLSAVLSGVGLDWLDQIRAYSDDEHHPIGGNAAAHYNVRRQINPDGQKKRERKMIPEKLAYYRDRDASPRLDNKFRQTLTNGLEEEVAKLPAYAMLCSQLGYGERTFAA